MDFSDQTVVVTGAAGNLGHAVAVAFAKLGANVVLVGLHAESLAERFGSDNDRQLFVAADLRMQSQASAAAEAAIARFRRIDVLCNIAGGFRMGEAVHETSDETWDFLFDLNVRSLLNMVARDRAADARTRRRTHRQHRRVCSAEGRREHGRVLRRRRRRSFD